MFVFLFVNTILFFYVFYITYFFVIKIKNCLNFLFKNLLGVRNKPDLVTEWDHLYNLKNQNVLRKDCRLLIEKIGTDSYITVPQLESLITLYCKRRNVEYETDCGWLDVLEKLVILPFEQSTLFNVFYAITTKYIPKYKFLKFIIKKFF